MDQQHIRNRNRPRKKSKPQTNPNRHHLRPIKRFYQSLHPLRPQKLLRKMRLHPHRHPKKLRRRLRHHLQPAPGGRKNPAPGLIPHQRERGPVTVPFIRPPPTAYNLQFYITTLLQLLQLLLPLHSDLLKLLDRPRNLRQRLRFIRTDIIQRRNRIRKRLL